MGKGKMKERKGERMIMLDTHFCDNCSLLYISLDNYMSFLSTEKWLLGKRNKNSGCWENDKSGGKILW